MLDAYQIITIVLYGILIVTQIGLFISLFKKARRKKLFPGCRKSFAWCFVIFLFFSVWITILNLCIYLIDYFGLKSVLEWNIGDTIILASMKFIFLLLLWGLLFISYTFLFVSVDYTLFWKKTKGNLAILSTLIIGLIFLIRLGVFITKFFVSSDLAVIYIDFFSLVLIDFSLILISWYISVIFAKISNESTYIHLYSDYKKNLVRGFLLLLIINPFLRIMRNIIIFFYGIFESKNSDFFISSEALSIISSIFHYVISIFFLVGIIFLSIGAYYTMVIYLEYHREKKPYIKLEDKFCKGCNEKIIPGLKFCISCGHKIEIEEYFPSESKTNWG